MRTFKFVLQKARIFMFCPKVCNKQLIFYIKKTFKTSKIFVLMRKTKGIVLTF